MTRRLNSPMVINGCVSKPDSWDYAGLVAQVQATGTVQFGGTETNGDVLTLTLVSQQLPNGTYPLAYTTSGNQSINSIATAFRDLINNDKLLQSLGISATVSTNTVTVKWAAGPLGNFATMTFGNSGVSETATIVQFKGGAGYIIPQKDATVMNGNSPVNLKASEPIQVDYLLLKAIIASGVSIK